jgi:hypothetical protein
VQQFYLSLADATTVSKAQVSLQLTIEINGLKCSIMRSICALQGHRLLRWPNSAQHGRTLELVDDRKFNDAIVYEAKVFLVISTPQLMPSIT